MKKLILSTLFATTGFIGANQLQPVPGAVYVEVKGVPGTPGRLIVYKGIYYYHDAVLNTFNKLLKTPLISFFDKKGQKIGKDEPLTDWQALDTTSDSFTWKNYQKFIAKLQARLAGLPKVRKAKVVPGVKGHGHQHIELFDKHGRLIANIELSDWNTLKAGDYIPKKAIHALAEYVRNPEDLQDMTVSEITPKLNWRTMIGRK